MKDAGGNLYTKTINKWENVDLGDDRDFVKLTQTTTFAYDGDSDHREIGTTFAYDDDTGNLTEKVEYGEVSGSDNGTFTDTGTDKRTTTDHLRRKHDAVHPRPPVSRAPGQPGLEHRERHQALLRQPFASAMSTREMRRRPNSGNQARATPRRQNHIIPTASPRKQPMAGATRPPTRTTASICMSLPRRTHFHKPLATSMTTRLESQNRSLMRTTGYLKRSTTGSTGR